MRYKSIIVATSATKPSDNAPEIHKIHKPQSSSAPTRATPQYSSSPLPPPVGWALPTSSSVDATTSSCATAVSAVSPHFHSPLIARWFNLDNSPQRRLSLLPKIKLPQLLPGQIILLTGPSGSGKSTLLRRFRRRCQIPLINIPRIPLTHEAVIDHFPHISIESALSHLSRV